MHHSEIKWTLIFDRENDVFSDYEEIKVVLGPRTSHTPSIAIWNEKSVTRWLRQNNPDIYFSPDGFIPLRSSVRCVPVVHDLAPLVFPQYMRWRDYVYYRVFQIRMIKRAWLVSTVSSFSKNEIVKYSGVKAEKVFVAYNGLHSGISSAKRTAPGVVKYNLDEPYFLYYGSIHPRKNVFGVIKSFEFYRASGGKVELVLVGRRAWKSTEVDDLLTHSPVAAHIKWLPYLENEELQYVLSEALCLIYISHYEGFGLPVLEAMASGVPVITSSDSAMSEIGEEAVVTRAALDHQGVAAEMKHLEEDDEFRDEMIERGKTQAKKFNYFNSSELILKTMKLKLNED